MLNYNHLYYFHVAASEGSLAAAALKLGVKQSTVSEQLRSLERSLQQTLFERSASGMRLTSSGLLAFEHTTSMFRASDQMLQAFGIARAASPITLRVGASGAVARATSTDFLLPLFALEDCSPSITIGPAPDLLRDLRSNELDLVLCESEPPAAALQGLQRAVIDHIPLVAIAATGVDPGPDWQDVGLVQYRATSLFHYEVEAFLEARGLRPRILGEADDPCLLVEAAARGHVVIVPKSAARDALANGRVRILAQLESGTAGVHAIYPDGSAQILVQRAIERLVASVRAEPLAARA